MKIIVTGGAGFIGSALTRHLVLETGADVTVIDKLTYAANLESLAPVADRPNYRLLKLDICDQAAMRRVVGETQPDRIFHLAAESHVDRSITGPQAFAETNLMGTYSLLEAARDYWQSAVNSAFKFVHVSTDEVFGSLGADGAFSERSPYDPSSPYSASKAGSDHLAKAWARTYGLPVVISNCSNNYGPYQFPEKLIPLTILNALEGKPMRVYGDGLNVRDWLHVDDHVAALELIGDRGAAGETYMVGGHGERTNLQVVEAICDLVSEALGDGIDRRGLITFVEDRPGHDRRYSIDPAKISGELGWAPQHAFEPGLKQTVAWYLANQDWWQSLRERVYDGERLGLIAPATAK